MTNIREFHAENMFGYIVGRRDPIEGEPYDIVKVQIPVETNAKKLYMLVYNADRSIERMMEAQPRFLDELKESKKGFYKVAVSLPGRRLKFGERVEDQAW